MESSFWVCLEGLFGVVLEGPLCESFVGSFGGYIQIVIRDWNLRLNLPSCSSNLFMKIQTYTFSY